MNAHDIALPVACVAKPFQASPQEKAQWAKRFLESGLSLRKFSDQHALPHVSLWRWVDKAREQAAGLNRGAEPAFAEIKLEPCVERSDWAAELSLPGGKVLRLSKDVPAPMLEQLLRLC